MARKNFWEKDEKDKISQPEQNVFGSGMKTQSSPTQSSKSIAGSVKTAGSSNPNIPNLGNLNALNQQISNPNWVNPNYYIRDLQNRQQASGNVQSGTTQSSNYDQQTMSSEDYARLRQIQREYNSTTDPARRAALHQEANRLRAGYGYAMSGNNRVDFGDGGYDKMIMSDEDFAAYRQAVADYHSASTQAEKDAAHAKAEEIRNKYGYSMGTTGGDFTPNNPIPGVSDNTMANMLHWMASANNPTGNSEWYDQWQRLYEQYMNRDPFEYDMNEDPLYQQYAEQYTRLGNQAMQDTLGQAAALTGGYDSSYSQSAGQQAYQGYLDKLNDVVPELYNQAYGRWQDEGDLLLNQGSAAAQIYGQQVSDYWNNLNYWTQQAQNESGNSLNQQEFEFNQQQTNYSNLVTSISNTGYKPTDAELQAAGMTREEANMWLQMYQRSLATSAKSSGGSSGGSRRSSGGRGGGYSSGGGDSSSSSTDTLDPISSAAAKYAASNPKGYLDSRTLDNYLSSQGYSSQERAQFKQYLQSLGWTYSRNM